jgi:hypothetical protein
MIAALVAWSAPTVVGNFGNALATDYIPARDFDRYAGIRVSLSY